MSGHVGQTRPVPREECVAAAKQLMHLRLKAAATWLLELAATSQDNGSAASCESQQQYHLSVDDSIDYLLAACYFDSLEYSRCAHKLNTTFQFSARDAISNNSALFLYCYSLYLDGERRKAEHAAEQGDKQEACTFSNPHLHRLKDLLEPMYESKRLDGPSLYIYGVILREMNCKPSAIAAFLESVRAYPLNWSCWLDLAELVQSTSEVQSMDLPDHWCSDFFKAHVYLELHNEEAALQLYSDIRECVGAVPHVQCQLARAQFLSQDFVSANDTFAAVRKTDPYMLQSMDVYSNVLYLHDDVTELSLLAAHALKVDKFRPETSCICGNYYSKRGQHAEAVRYFRRALQVDRKQAVSVNPRDYRAWYGLGQTYEILSMFAYAVHYFRKVVAIRPHDARVWCALGDCFTKSGQENDSILCFQRAVQVGDRQGIARQRLGKIYAKQQAFREAAEHYTAFVEQQTITDVIQSEDVVEALLFLAQYCANEARYSDAEAYARKVVDSPFPEQAHAAQDIIRQVASASNRQAAGSAVLGSMSHTERHDMSAMDMSALSFGTDASSPSPNKSRAW